MDTGINNRTIMDDKQNRILSLSTLFHGEFSIDTLIGLSGCLASEILASLDEGIRNSWIVTKGPGVYLFRDETKRDELKSLISDMERQKYHRIIADMILQGLPYDIKREKQAAYHLLKTKNDLKGCRVLSNAGDAYSRLFQDRLAMECYGKVVIDLSHREDAAAAQLFVDNINKYSKIFTGEDDPEWIIPLLKKAIHMTETGDLQQFQSILEMQLAKNQWFQGHFKEAIKSFEEGWAIAQESENPKVVGSANVFRIFFSHWQGRYADVIKAYEALVPEIDRFPISRATLLAAIAAGQCYVRNGRVSHGLGILDSLYKHREKLGDQSGIVQISNAVGAVLIEIGRYADAIKYLEKAQEKMVGAQTAFDRNYRHIFLALANMLIKDSRKADVHLKELSRLHANINIPSYASNHMIALSWAIGKEAAARYPALDLSKLIQHCIHSENISDRGAGYRYLALAEKTQGSPAEKIVPLLKKSVGYYEEAGNLILGARSKMLLAIEYQRMGKEDEARSVGEAAAQVLLPINPNLIPKEYTAFTKNLPYQETVLDKIIKSGQELVTIRDNRELVSHIIATSNQITGAERGAIFFIDKASNPSELKLKASKNISIDDVALPGFDRSMEIIKKTAMEGVGCVVKFPQTDSAEASNDSILSCFCVPMIFKDEILGVLYHDNCMFRNAVEEIDLNVLSFFAAQAAIALDNARAYEQVQRLNQQLQQEKDYFKEQHLKDFQYEGVVGNSPSIRKIFTQVEKVAPEDTTVLILGETGVGKEVVARLVHQMGKRKDKSFIRVDCSALSETLIATELFGHEKGAFTGAAKRHIGRFELANGGTLFLDEIGNISPEIQVRLLRVLQTKEFQRVGGRETIQSDFRLLTATNKDLQKEVKAGRFREDLYYRLNIFPVTVPPLRERREDIPLLTKFFLRRHAAKVGRPILKVSKKSMENLMDYGWPGNVRELENVIERSIILSSDAWLNLVPLSSGKEQKTHLTRRISLKENERRHILWALEETEGKIRGKGGAAELLDIHHNTLRSRMKKLGIQPNKRVFSLDRNEP